MLADFELHLGEYCRHLYSTRLASLGITGHQWVLSDGQVHLSVNPSGDAKKLIRTEADDSGLELCSGQQICNGRLDA